ncbi:MAG: peptidylprolyl isomerase [Parvularculaceae bacterium]
MTTEETRKPDPPARESPLIAAGRAFVDILRGLARVLHWLGAGFLWIAIRLARAVAALWRFLGVLDAALWRAMKAAAFTIWRGATVGAGWVFAAGAGIFEWLSTRWGRAYSAGSGVVLIVAGLWIVDELRSAPGRPDSASQREQAPIDAEDPILARVDGRYVHLSEVEVAARAQGALREDEHLTAEAAFARDLVKAFVEQRLLAGAAVDAGLHRSTPISRRIGAARDRILAAAFMESRIKEAVTAESVRALYRSQSGVTALGDEIRARHILVETKEEADAVIKELDGGGDFADLARERSLDRATAPLGGEIGYFTKDMMAPAFSHAAFAAAKGEIAPPFETEFGWHVLEILDRRPTRRASFARVRTDIERFLTLRTIDSTLAQLAEKSDVVYFEPAESADASEPATGSPSPAGAPGDSKDGALR